MNLIVILDFDGVIVDSIQGLFDCFGKFLKKHGHKANQTSFDRYNGMKLQDILLDLKSKYQITNSIKELRADYEELIQDVYQECNLMPGVKNFLDFCQNHKIPVCIATGSERKNLINLLNRFNLKNRFQYIITADEVHKAKPNPEMYLKIKKEMGHGQYIVVDDSENGIKAAINANMNPIHFTKNFNNSNYLSVPTFMELTTLLTKYILTNNPNYQFEKITTEVVPSFLEDSNEINKYWDLITRENPSLFNGPLYQVLSFSFKKNNKNIHLKLSELDYKNWLHQKHILKKKNKEKSLISLGVTGVVMNSQGKILVGRRGPNLYSYPNYLELPPSGTVEPGRGNPKDQLIRELEEEIGISKKNISSIKPMINYFDYKSDILDIAYLISLNDIPTMLEASDEYSELMFIEISRAKIMLTEESSVETSKVLLNLL